MKSRPRFTCRHGFTLIELLVAISLMALMTALNWRGIDGITQTQAQLRQRADDVLTLQASLGQWTADLEAISSQPDYPGLDWDGRALRILRRSSSGPQDGLQVVAWATRGISGQRHWLRWHSPPLRTRGELSQAWQKAARWAQSPGDDDRGREVQTVAVDSWQIFYHRGNAWTNPLSSAGTTVGSPAEGLNAGLPDGVRLILTLSSGQALDGTVSRDWVSPTLAGGK